jgi:hypothetical protein
MPLIRGPAVCGRIIPFWLAVVVTRLGGLGRFARQDRRRQRRSQAQEEWFGSIHTANG